MGHGLHSNNKHIKIDSKIGDEEKVEIMHNDIRNSKAT